MPPHVHDTFDRYSAMEHCYHDGDQYYDTSLPISTHYDYTSYQPYSYYIPDNMMLAMTDLQGEQQLIQTPVHEYHPQTFDNLTSSSVHSVSSDSSCSTSTDFHDTAAYPSIPTYASDRRPSYPPSWAQDVRNNSTHVPAAQSSEYRATIARLSDDFLASASSLFGGSASRSSNTSSTLSGPATPHQSPMQNSNPTPARKRSSEVMNEEVFVDQRLDARASIQDSRYLPQPHMIVPSQNRVVRERRLPQGSSHSSESQGLLRSPARPFRQSLSPDSLLLREEGRPAAHQANKRPHRSEEITRHSQTISSVPATWSAPVEPVMKVSASRKTGEQKKQALACLFCRERKIACGRPPAHSPDQTCNQCARRRMKCEYPTESRRGQHKRIRRKPTEDCIGASNSSSASQSAPNTPPVIALTA
ncbi:uncharacterized protein F5891DRAFT_208570 [Suillus fuscotomentosus]|uniref:Zn(2)-C6 fungal-type domain-containing protein n=1 Tax=Suillus fuscotomentosus TaxID=1912939 RepID=A0AAD4HRQ8_9AGAM|nr:uncharacterized protein F5891DRAFT_208570 [Suillus fuscotomentosus]KAG1907665.1 hypothetical protein F5891DRAFT_208570 [Suillus fuscotomentosus]